MRHSLLLLGCEGCCLLWVHVHGHRVHGHHGWVRRRIISAEAGRLLLLHQHELLALMWCQVIHIDVSTAGHHHSRIYSSIAGIILSWITA
jgi:hypothetical protein